MRLVFAGTPEFARIAFDALRAAGHDIPLVMTQPDRPAGRGLKLTPSPVKQAALDAGIEVAQPRSLRLDGRYPEEAAEARALLERIAPDVMVVAAYGLILPQWVLDLPRLGCLNIHASLLPRWRGAAPIQAAILAGDATTGITIMQMDAGLDTGPLLLHAAVPITAATTAAALHDMLAELGAGLILRVLDAPPSPVPQPAAGATYALKLMRADGRLDWTQDALALARRVRALNPWPGTFCLADGAVLKILAASAEPGAGEPGTVLDAALLVATGAGALRLLVVQAPGRAPLAAEAFLRGRRIPPGHRLH